MLICNLEKMLQLLEPVSSPKVWVSRSYDKLKGNKFDSIPFNFLCQVRNFAAIGRSVLLDALEATGIAEFTLHISFLTISVNMAQKCVHKGCGKVFSDPEEPCVYHPGPPEFHEGQKGWLARFVDHFSLL